MRNVAWILPIPHLVLRKLNLVLHIIEINASRCFWHSLLFERHGEAKLSTATAGMLIHSRSCYSQSAASTCLDNFWHDVERLFYCRLKNWFQFFDSVGIKQLVSTISALFHLNCKNASAHRIINSDLNLALLTSDLSVGEVCFCDRAWLGGGELLDGVITQHEDGLLESASVP